MDTGRLRGIPFKGELPGDFAQRCRKMESRFWQFLCDSLKEQMQAELRVMAAMFPLPPPSSEYRLYFSQVKPSIFLNIVPGSLAAAPDTARDPPQVFAPIPNKTELGSCARSDSLVRLLIWRAVPPVQFML